jgi:hypothetical protein
MKGRNERKKGMNGRQKGREGDRVVERERGKGYTKKGKKEERKEHLLKE